MLEKLLQRVEQVLSGYFVPKSDLEAANKVIESLNAKNSELSAELESIKSDLGTTTVSLSAANEQIETLKQSESAAKLESERLKAEAITVDAAAAAKARDICASQGIPADKVPDTQAKASTREQELESIRAEMAKETDPIKRGKLALKARELRGHKGAF